MIEPHFPEPTLVQAMSHSNLFRDHRGRYHWQTTIPQPQLGKTLRSEEELHAKGLLSTLTRYNSGSVIPTEKAFAFVTKRMAREYYLGKVGDKYHAILRAARAGKRLRYYAPMNIKPVTFGLDETGQSRYSYRVVGDRILFTPPGYHPNESLREADRFFADHKHAYRMEVVTDG